MIPRASLTVVPSVTSCLSLLKKSDEEYSRDSLNVLDPANQSLRVSNFESAGLSFAASEFGDSKAMQKTSWSGMVDVNSLVE